MRNRQQRTGKNSIRYRGTFPIDKIGERHGNLTVIFPGGRKVIGSNTKISWICRCDCGNTKEITESSLACKVKSCGCARKGPNTEKIKFKPGDKAGNLTLNRSLYKGKFKFWECSCKCGGSITTREDSIRRGATVSCGCKHKESIGISQKTHGLSVSRLSNIYRNMLKRCYFKKNYSYFNYGARGITVCEEWLAPAPEGFLNFHRWALISGYQDHLTLDRKDNNKGYSPENCRWATPKEQSRNRRVTRKVTIEGKIMPLMDAYDRYGTTDISVNSVWVRILLGWDVMSALTTKNQIGKTKNAS